MPECPVQFVVREPTARVQGQSNGVVFMKRGVFCRAGLTVTACLLAIPLPASAHHSFAASFEVNVIEELEGEVVEIRWQNPHIEFDIVVFDESGQRRVRTVESQAISGLRRRNITEPFVSIGETVRVAGNPPRRDTGNFYLSNILLEDGTELVLRGNEPRFTDRVAESTGPTFATEGDGSEPERGIFRVWSTPSASPFPFPEDQNPDLAHTDFPLTAAARRTLEAFDPIDDNPINDCALKGMPTIMEQPYPMQFLEQDGNIVMHMEEYDTMRTFLMGSAADEVEPVPGILGHAVARWVGQTLIVETTDVNWGWFDTVGIPLSEDARIVELFTLAIDGSRLDWRMRVTDSANFTEPVEVDKYFLYVPGVEVQPYACTVSGD